jgi:hypothetical protein
MGHMYLFFREIFSEKKDKKSPGNRVECAPCAPGKSPVPLLRRSSEDFPWVFFFSAFT